MYIIAKHAHFTLIAISVLFLIIRVVARSANAQWLKAKWAKILPHVIDTFLLISAICLMIVLQQYPIINGWLSAKVVALFGYIGFATMAMKGEKAVLTRFAFLATALLCIGYMASTAITKQPLPF